MVDDNSDTRASARKLFHRVGAWGTANAIKQSLGVAKLTAIKQGSDEALVNRVLDEVPFGSVVNINQGEPKTGLSTAAKLAGAGALAVLAGVGGYMYAGNTSASPAPVDAVLSWEIDDAGSVSGTIGNARGEDSNTGDGHQ